MSVTIADAGPPIDQKDILRLQILMQLKFEADHKRFLLENNGGRPSLDIIDISGLSGVSTDVRVFCGTNRPVATENIEWYIENEPDIFAHGMIPVALDSCGGTFLQVVREDERLGGLARLGAILFAEPTGERRKLYHVAESFGRLLEMLYPLPEDRG